jgi:hypothetical protein
LWQVPVLLFAAGVAILLVRNPDPVLNPVLYAEDGVWAGRGLSEGWWTVLVHARPDYLVVANVALLFIAANVSSAISGNPLLLLPQAVAWTSYGFYAGIATFAFVTLRAVGATLFALLGFLLLLLLPLGATQNEILGRVLQVGFFMPLVAVMLLFWRDVVRSGTTRVAVDLGLLLCAATNPFVLAQVFFYLCLDLSKDWKFLACARRTLTLTVPFALLGAYLAPDLGGKGAVPGELVGSNLVEAAVARPLLYPFLFPWYAHLSDVASVAGMVLFALLALLAFSRNASSKGRRLLILGLVSLALYDVATIANRPGLTALLAGYRTTFPDRYFMGLNALAVFLFVTCVAQLWRAGRGKIASLALSLALVAVYASSPSLVFETGAARLPIMVGLGFREQMCLSEPAAEGHGRSVIRIYPQLDIWRMTVPTRYIVKEHCEFASYEEAGITRPGESYSLRPSPPLTAASEIRLSMTAGHSNPDTGLRRIGVMLGTYARENAGEAELRLAGGDGTQITLRFALPGIVDNQYRYFNLDSGRYNEGAIVGVSGGGVSTWESFGAGGAVQTCIRYEYADGSRRFTPGCP